METKNKSIEKFISSELYQKAINEIIALTDIGVDFEYEDVLKELDIKKLSIANLTVFDIEQILNYDYQKLISFSTNSIKKYHNKSVEQEYPIGEEVEEENDNAVYGNYVISFFLIYIIEYYFLKNKPSELITYLKSSRIPQAKKFEKELKEIYNKMKDE
jgi:hypothetical protein